MITHEVIFTIVNRGFADEVMTAAKAAGASGGTVINARGTGTSELQRFFGMPIQPEKELVIIVTEREKRNGIMEAICNDAGLAKPGSGICFSLPVDAVQGINNTERTEEEADSKRSAAALKKERDQSVPAPKE